MPGTRNPTTTPATSPHRTAWHVDTVQVPETHVRTAIERNADTSTDRDNAEYCLATDQITIHDGNVVMTLTIGVIDDDQYREHGVHWNSGRLYISPVFFTNTTDITTIQTDAETVELSDTVILERNPVTVRYETREDTNSASE
jgi:hypothetical protein